MNKKMLKLLSSLSLLFIAGCQTNVSSSNTNKISSMSSSSSISEVSSSSSSSEENSNSSSSTSEISSNLPSSSSDNSSEEYPVVEDEEKYIADETKKVNVTINVSYPDATNDIYIIGDFNNWGKFNTLNDNSYKVNNGSISISNIENNETYEYMFVQKIEGASYTYNFNKTQIDSEGNQIIGYTKDGDLISQYCISQSDEKFSFVANEGGSYDVSVSSWKEAVYGEKIKVNDPNKSYEVPMSGYNLCISPASEPENVYYIPLEARTDTDGEGRQQYAVYNVELGLGDAFTIYDGNNNTGWAETNIEPYGASESFGVNSQVGVCTLEEGTYDIYVKLAYNNNRIYIEKSGSSSEGGNESGSTTAPTTGYALLVTPGNGGSQYYVALTQVDEFDGFQQHFADDVKLSNGDVFVLYDCTNQVSWVEDTLSQYGQYQKFSITSSGIKCNENGVYDIYVKFKYEADEIYIGNQDGQ